MLISISAGVTQETWDKMDSFQRSEYLRKYPNSRYAPKAEHDKKSATSKDPVAVNQAAILRIVEKSGLDGLMKALKGLNTEDLYMHDNRVDVEGNSRYSPFEEWDKAMAALERTVNKLLYD